MGGSAIPWFRVGTVVLCGVVTALSIGKIPPALPELKSSLGLGLIVSGLVIGAFNVLGASFGFGIGVLTDRLGARRLILAALACSVLGNFWGALAAGPGVLILTRVFEGFGFLAVLTGAPTLLNASVRTEDRGLVMGLWGTFMPVGTGLSILAAPVLLEDFGWRGLWIAVGVVALLTIPLFLRAFPRPTVEHPSPPRRTELVAVLRTWPLILVGVAFGAYSFNYIPVLSFLPLWLIETHGFTLTMGAAVALAYSVANLIGNVSAGMLMRHGAQPARLIAVAGAVMGVMALVIFLPGPPVAVRITAALVFACIGGWIPGSSFALVLQFAPAPHLVGASNGVLVQLLNVGTLLGPILVTATVKLGGGWAAAPIALVAASAVSLAAALTVERMARAPSAAPL